MLITEEQEGEIKKNLKNYSRRLICVARLTIEFVVPGHTQYDFHYQVTQIR